MYVCNVYVCMYVCMYVCKSVRWLTINYTGMRLLLKILFSYALTTAVSW